MIEQGEIIKIDNDKVIIKVTRDSDCESCHLCEEKSDGSFIIEVPDPGGLNPGDLVKIEIPEKKMIQGALLLYGLPILGLFAGFFIGNILSKLIGLTSSQELFSVIIGFTTFVLAFLLVKYFYKKKSGPFSAAIVEKINKEASDIRKDPVCGMNVSLENPPVSTVYKGQTYLFCSGDCKNMFEENPDKYINT